MKYKATDIKTLNFSRVIEQVRRDETFKTTMHISGAKPEICLREGVLFF